MKDALRFVASGIKCDKNSCDYKDDSIQIEDYHEWVNKPCPKCGSNLLTEGDYQAVQSMLSLADMFNGIFPKVPNSTKEDVIKVELNGKGDIKLEKQ